MRPFRKFLNDLTGAHAFADVVDQIRHHGDVHDQKRKLDPGNVSDDLEHLPGKERSGHDDRQVFSPGLLHQQSYAFDDIDGGVGKDCRADHAQAVIVEEGNLVEHNVHKAAFRIEVELR